MANKIGDTKGSGKSRRRWDGRRWVSAPPRRTPAPTTTSTRQENRRSTRGQGNRTLNRSSSSSLSTIPASKRPADMRQGVTYGDAGRPYKGPGGDPKGTGKGQAQQAPPAPQLPPKPTARRNVTPTPPTAPKKPTVATPKKPAVTTPAKPAARKPRTWLKENYKPGGPPKKAVTPKKKKLTNKQRKQGGFH